MSVAISLTARLPKGSLASLAHQLEQRVPRFDVPVPHANCVEVINTHYDRRHSPRRSKIESLNVSKKSPRPLQPCVAQAR